MNDISIKVDNLTKVYRLYDKPIDRLKESLSPIKKSYHREHYALKNVSFEIKKGETVGIIGVNGAGKSTILKIITGVLNPTSGSVTVNGKISALLELGAGFNPEYTGIENIYLNGTMMGFTRDEINERIDSILDFADIGDFVNQPVKTYSSGMFVRLAFAVAINIDPEILIVDEALSVGDVFFQAKCYKKFEEFKKMGKTILLVSHSMSSINKYCDKVILLNKGVKEAEGKPAEMIDLYKKLLVNVNIDNAYENNNTNGDKENINRDDRVWKDMLTINPKINSYGNNMAEIIDFGIFDSNGNVTNQIEKGKNFEIKMKVKFSSYICDPIFAFTIVNLQGTDITGTNTMYENINIKPVNENDEVTVTFKQKMDIQGGEYFLSLGCTGYMGGEFVVYHRLYEICSITVISDKNTVGFYDMNSEIEVEQGD